MTRQFEKGEKYRPVVKVLKVKKDVPTVIEASGRRYVLEHQNQFKKRMAE